MLLTGTKLYARVMVWQLGCCQAVLGGCYGVDRWLLIGSNQNSQLESFLNIMISEHGFFYRPPQFHTNSQRFYLNKVELILDQDSDFKHMGHVVRKTSVMAKETRCHPTPFVSINSSVNVRQKGKCMSHAALYRFPRYNLCVHNRLFV